MATRNTRDRIGVLSAAFAMASFAVVGLASAAPGCGSSDDSSSSSAGSDGAIDSHVEEVAAFDTSSSADTSVNVDTTGFDFAHSDVPTNEVDAPVIPCGETGGDAPACPLPPSTCVDATWLASFSGASCVDGTCKYDVVYTDCSASGEECDAGACHTVILK